MKNNFTRKVLPNGMTVLFEKRDLPVVSVAFALRAGGVNESESEKGISHFIEHMLYKGTPTRNSKKIAEEIEKNGGELNGFTSEEITAYWCKMPSEKFDIAIEVLSDIVKNPKFDNNELEKERKVIFEEIKMYHDNPLRYSIEEIQKNLYTGTMGINLAGTYETMNSITREDLVKKFKEIYKPNNMILCVVGNADYLEIEKFAKENFDNKNGKVPVHKFELINKVRVEKRKGIDQTNMVYAYHVPIASEKNSYAAQVLNTLMGGGMSSRLFSEIREKRNLAYMIKGDSDINKNFAYNMIYVGTMKDNVKKVKELIIKEFEEVSKNLTEEELNEIKNQMIGQYNISMEDSQSQMVGLIISEIQGNAKNYYEYEKNIKAVKLSDVKKLAKHATKKYSMFTLMPED